MEVYAAGHGQDDLGSRLNIKHSSSLAIGGSANSRIIRTTLKHSYLTTVPTFYAIGATFLSRNEIAILTRDDNAFEGTWTNPQNQQFKDRWIPTWTQRDTEKYVELKLKSDMFSTIDRLEDLQYRWLSLIESLRSRGHGCVIYQQSDDLHLEYMDDPRMKFFNLYPEIVNGYRWRAIAWQYHQGIPPAYQSGVPDEMKHPATGHHQLVNEYLADYIKQQQLI
jgi:hypothetical protein